MPSPDVSPNRTKALMLFSNIFLAMQDTNITYSSTHLCPSFSFSLSFILSISSTYTPTPMLYLP